MLACKKNPRGAERAHSWFHAVTVVHVSMIMASKRQYEEDCDISNLTPMKKSKTCEFFDGSLTDGKTAIRLYGFDPSIRNKLAKFDEDKTSLTLSNCEIKPSRRGDQLEVRLTKATEIKKSEKNFEIQKTVIKEKINIIELEGLLPFQCVAVEAKLSR